jgi:hypothetical protein
MKVVLLIDNYFKEVNTVYTIERFIQETNNLYKEIHTEEIKEPFTIYTLDKAIDWFVNNVEETGVSVMEVEGV